MVLCCLLSHFFQAPPSPLSWIVHLTTSISASALILVSQLLVFTWNIQVAYLSCIQLFLQHMFHIHNDDRSIYNHVYFTFLNSYWSGVMSRASNSKLWNKTRRQIYGGRRRAVFMWTRILSSGKITICVYTVCLSLQTRTTYWGSERNWRIVIPDTKKHTHVPQVAIVSCKPADIHVKSLKAAFLMCRHSLFLSPGCTNEELYKLWIRRKPRSPVVFPALPKHTTLVWFAQLLNNVCLWCGLPDFLCSVQLKRRFEFLMLNIQLHSINTVVIAKHEYCCWVDKTPLLNQIN